MFSHVVLCAVFRNILRGDCGVVMIEFYDQNGHIVFGNIFIQFKSEVENFIGKSLRVGAVLSG